MDALMLQRIKRIRTENPYIPTRMIDAVRQARYEANDAPGGFTFLSDVVDMPGHTAAQVGPFTVTVTVSDDEDSMLGDDDVTGTFGREYQEGAIQYNGTGRNNDWYYPSNSRMQESDADYAHYGLSRAVLHEMRAWQLQQDANNDADRYYLGVDVTVSHLDRELAAESLWGIDCLMGGIGDAYIREVASELIIECLGTVREEAQKIVRAAREQTESLARALGIE